MSEKGVLVNLQIKGGLMEVQLVVTGPTKKINGLPSSSLIDWAYFTHNDFL